MKKWHFKITLTIFLFLVGFLVLADTNDPFAELTYPIPELDNCESRDTCETYCENPNNAESCLNYAEAHGLMSVQEIEEARRMLALGIISGPGGCRGQAECEAYCDIIAHMEECLEFALANDLVPPEELEDAQKVIAAIRQGITPPNCQGKTECDIYCSQPQNMEECMKFAIAAGLMPPDEMEEAQMVLEAIKRGFTPPPCQGEEECDQYCSIPEHIEQCIDFAVAAGFMSEEEAEMVKRTGGRGPGGCRGEEECEAFCENPDNAEECINFAIEYGFMSAEEAAEAKRMLELGLTGGPGGCQGKECETYCDDVSHMKECIEFSLQAGFMEPEEAERALRIAELGIMGGPGGCQSEQECKFFCDQPENMEECIDFGVLIGDMTPEEAEQAKKGMEMMMRGGPGGCKSEDECRAYCELPDHFEECLRFQVEMGFISQEEAQLMQQKMPTQPQGGPGGCQTEEECKTYCQDPVHYEECSVFRLETQAIPPPETQQMMEQQMQQQQIIIPGTEPFGGMKIPEEMMKSMEMGEMMPYPEEIMGIPEQILTPQEMESLEGMMPPENMMMPPPTEVVPPPPKEEVPPQSLLEQVLDDLLASIINAFEF